MTWAVSTPGLQLVAKLPSVSWAVFLTDFNVNPQKGRGSKSQGWSLVQTSGLLATVSLLPAWGLHWTQQPKARAEGTGGGGAQQPRGKCGSLCLPQLPLFSRDRFAEPASRSRGGWATSTMSPTHKPHKGLMYTYTVSSHFFLQMRLREGTGSGSFSESMRQGLEYRL